MAPITEGMTEPLCLKCGHGIDAHGSFGCLDCSHESICVEQASAIYRQALAEAQADSARLDWLDTQRGEIASDDGTELYAHTWGVYAQRNNVRDAIDASRQPDPAPGGTENGR